MPIQLNYTDPSSGQNTPASYWLARKATIDSVTGIVNFTLYGYVSLAARQAGRNEFYVVAGEATFAQLQGVNNNTTIGTLAANIYTWALANMPFFAGGAIV